MTVHTGHRIGTAVLLAAVWAAGCGRISEPLTASQDVHAHETAAFVLHHAAPDALARIRAATARYHSIAQARAAGYAQVSGCVARPGGTPAMGIHYENTILVDGVLELDRPEALLYVPKENGNLELVGVEYIILNTGQDRPSLDGYPFDVGGVGPLTRAGIAHWSLHVWIWQDNPAGIFVPFNPSVSCS